MQDACQNTYECPDRYYCDPGANTCHACSAICQTYIHSDCQHFCPGFLPTSSSLHPTLSTTTFLSSSTFISTDVYFIIIIVIICVVIVVIIPLIICFIYIHRRKRPDVSNPPVLPVSITDSTMIGSPVDDLEMATSPGRSRYESTEFAPLQHPTSGERFTQEVGHMETDVDVHREMETSGTRPKDPNRHRHVDNRYSEADLSYSRKATHKPQLLASQQSVHKSQIVDQSSDESTDMRYKRRRSGQSPDHRKRNPLHLKDSYISVEFKPPHMISQATMTDIELSTTSIKTKPGRNVDAKEKSTPEETQPLITETEDQPDARIQQLDQAGSVQKSNKPYGDAHGIDLTLEGGSETKTKTDKKPLLPRSKRFEPRFNIDVYSMELEPEDKDPLEKANQRRLLKKQRETAKAGAVSEERPQAGAMPEEQTQAGAMPEEQTQAGAMSEERAQVGAVSHEHLDKAAALAQIQMRTPGEDDRQEDLTLPKEAPYPSLILQETSDRELEPATPSIHEAMSSIHPSLALEPHDGAQTSLVRELYDDEVTSQTVSDAQDEHDQRIRAQLRKMRFVRDHVYHGTEQSIDVYVDTGIESLWALSELMQITGEKPNRYRIKHVSDLS